MPPETTTQDNGTELDVGAAEPIAPSTLRWRRMKARHAAGLVVCPAAEWPVNLLDELVAAGLISERRSLDMKFVATEVPAILRRCCQDLKEKRQRVGGPSNKLR